MKASKVFFSYTHDSDPHMKRVLDLSERLRSDGVDSNLDQYETSPNEGWAVWSRRQIREANYVLVICTEHYLNRYEGSEEQGIGAGAKWEGVIIGQELYESEGKNSKFIPIVFTRDEAKFIPIEMRRGTFYVLDSDARYDELYGHLTDQPRMVKRELGQLRELPPIRKEQQNPQPKPSETARDPEPLVTNTAVNRQLPLVVLAQPFGPELFVRAQRIRVRGKLLSLSILPSDPQQVAFIREMERKSSEPIGIAYNLTALFVRLKSSEQIIEKEEVLQLEFEEDEYATRGNSIQFSTLGYSVDQIAEMRVRRILLDESLDELSGGGNDYTRQSLENSIEGGYDSKFRISQSPLPSLYSAFRGKTEEFEEAARLYCVLLLLLTHTVSQILRLDVELRSPAKLNVNFEGARPPQYSNEEPFKILIKGTCDLDA
jgi:TIR domain